MREACGSFPKTCFWVLPLVDFWRFPERLLEVYLVMIHALEMDLRDCFTRMIFPEQNFCNLQNPL